MIGFSHTMIQVTQAGVLEQGGAVERLAAEYEESGLAHLPGLLSQPVLKALLKQLQTARFELTKELIVKGTTLLMPPSEPALLSLHFILNRPELFEIVSKITKVQRPGNFTSRLHRTCVSADQHIDWHDDSYQSRTVGLNLNLTTDKYSGGMFQLRDPQRRFRGEIGQLPAGDAFLFRIGSGWQHRLTLIEAGERTVAVGWFRTEPNWETFALSGFRSGRMSLE